MFREFVNEWSLAHGSSREGLAELRIEELALDLSTARANASPSEPIRHRSVGGFRTLGSDHGFVVDWSDLVQHHVGPSVVPC